MDAGLVLAKHIEEDDARYAGRLLDDRPQRLLAMFALDSRFSKTSTPTTLSATRPVLVLLTDLRLFVVAKKALRGRYVKFAIALIDVVEVAVVKRHSGYYLLAISLNDGVDKVRRIALVAQEALQMELASLLVESGVLMQMGRAPQDRIRWHFPDGFPIDADVVSSPDWRDALELQYRAQCDAHRQLPSPAVVSAMHSIPLSVIDPIALLRSARPHPPSIKVLCLALRNCNLFTSIRLENVPHLGDEGVANLALAMGLYNHITTITLANVGLGRIGLDAISAAIVAHVAPSPIRDLTIFRATISSGAMKTLSSSLLQSSSLLVRLDLASCALSSTTISLLATSLLSSDVCVNTLEYLNLSNAQAGRPGSNALASFLMEARSLKWLVLIQAHVHTKTIVTALQRNTILSTTILSGLNLSQNRLSSSAAVALAEILAATKTLHDLILSQVRVHLADLHVVVAAAVVVDVRLDLSGCDIGSGELVSLRDRRVHIDDGRLRCIDLSGCRLGFEGMARAIDATTTIGSLETLILNGNARSTMFGKGSVHLRDQLAKLVKSSSIRRLALNGYDGGAIPSPILAPMLEALAFAPTLQSLSIAAHHLTEATFLVLAGALRTNRGLVYLDVDDNLSSLRSLSALADSIRFNEALSVVRVDNDLARHHLHIDTINDTIRSRTSLNRRRRIVESAMMDDDPFASAAKDARFRHRHRYRHHNEVTGEDTTTLPQFGVDLELCELVAVAGYEPGLPIVLLQLERAVVVGDGLRHEGIFRVAPDARAQARTKECIDGGQFDEIALSSSPSCMANLIKIWFRSLPERLLAPLKGDEIELEVALARMTPRAAAVLTWLLDLCVVVVNDTRYNKMSAASLAIVFSPNLMGEVAGGDPIDSLRRSQDISRLMELWITSRMALHPSLPDFAALLDDRSSSCEDERSVALLPVSKGSESLLIHDKESMLKRESDDPISIVAAID